MRPYDAYRLSQMMTPQPALHLWLLARSSCIRVVSIVIRQGTRRCEAKTVSHTPVFAYGADLMARVSSR